MAKHTFEFKIQIAKLHLSRGMSITLISNESNINHSLLDYIRNMANVFVRTYKTRSALEKLVILKHIWKNSWSINEACIYFNIPSNITIVKWIRAYNARGLSGLEDKPRGATKLKKKSKTSHKPIKEMSTEELREELEYKRAEVEVLKKLEALQLMKTSPIEKKLK